MPKEFGRTDRVAEEIRRIIAVLLLREVRDPRLSQVTVSAVKVSRDMAHATVYVSFVGDGDGARQMLQALQHAAGFLRSGVARQLSMRSVPELQFVRDTSLEHGNRLSALIEKANEPGSGTEGEG